MIDGGVLLDKLDSLLHEVGYDIHASTILDQSRAKDMRYKRYFPSEKNLPRLRYEYTMLVSLN